MRSKYFSVLKSQFSKLNFTQKVALAVLFLILVSAPLVFFSAQNRKLTSSRASEPASTSQPATPSNLFGQTAYLQNRVSSDKQMLLVSRQSKVLLTSDFTIEFWMNMHERKNGTFPAIFSMGRDFALFTDTGPNQTGNKLMLFTNDGTGITSLAGPEIRLKNWYHVAVTFKRTGTNIGTVALHVNGKAVVKTGMKFKDEMYAIEVGGSNFYAKEGNMYVGEIDELRISNNVRYVQSTNPILPPVRPFVSDSRTLLLAHLDGNGTDSSSYKNMISLNGGMSFATSTMYPRNNFPYIVTSRISDALSGAQYMFKVVARDNDRGDKLDIELGGLPPGLSIAVCPTTVPNPSLSPTPTPGYVEATTCIQGKALQSGKTEVFINATDSKSIPGKMYPVKTSVSKKLPLNVNNYPPVIATTSLPVAVLGAQMNFMIVGVDYDKNDTLTLKASLPPGLTQGPCTTVIESTRKRIDCQITGSITQISEVLDQTYLPFGISLSDGKDTIVSSLLLPVFDNR